MTQVLERPRAQTGLMETDEQSDAFDLERIVSSKSFTPQKVVVYGVPGVGKTTFAATWPKPILLRTEDGAGALDVPTFPFVVKTLDEMSRVVSSLLKSPHEFKTFVIDSLDWLEPIVWEAVCAENGKNNIEDFGYGKGYIKVDDKWRAIQRGLDMLRERRNMHVVAIAHAVAQVFDPPDTDPYMRYAIKLHKRAASLWTEWAEQLLFLNYDVKIKEASASGKSKAVGSGDRLIYTTEKPAWIAKSRWPLPDKIYVGSDPEWKAYHEALKEATEGRYCND